ncbi:MAG: hypothetical protein H9855_14860 [Candidatus Acinetobacter avistercoris]|uniref:hypothetical protein n=1 Tax=Acinetobacter sp. KS-LM10 TaxID=3120518 RepID=UPI001FA27AEA|nr:hypothetical protein [Candidatus Acinetobacter avistercoris]
MIPELDEKYQRLTTAQKEIFKGYGLRQVKHFVEISLPQIMNALPDQAIVLGVNAEGKIQATCLATDVHYIWISDKQWQERTNPNLSIDSKEDFIEVWKIFALEQYDLIDLSHVHRDFLNQQEA